MINLVRNQLLLRNISEVTTRAVHVNHQEPMTMEFCFPNQVIARIQAQEPQFIVLFREVLNAASTIR